LCSSVQHFRTASITSTAPRFFMDNVAVTSNETNKSRTVARRFSKISVSARAVFTSVLLVLNRLVRLWAFGRPFSKSPHQILTCCIHHKISIHLNQLAINYVRGMIRPNHNTNLFERPGFSCHGTSPYLMNSIWHDICCMLSPQELPNTKK
jgi:hypothetical protein